MGDERRYYWSEFAFALFFSDQINSQGFAAHRLRWNQYIHENPVPNEKVRPHHRQLNGEEVDQNTPRHGEKQHFYQTKHRSQNKRKRVSALQRGENAQDIYLKKVNVQEERQ